MTFLAESKSKGPKFPDIPFITTPTTVEFLSRPHPIIQPVAAATMSTTVMGFDEQKLRNKSEKSEGTVTRFHKLEFKLPRVFTSALPERLATKQMDTYRGESESRKEAKTETKMETSTEIGTPATHMSGKSKKLEEILRKSDKLVFKNNNHFELNLKHRKTKVIS